MALNSHLDALLTLKKCWVVFPNHLLGSCGFSADWIYLLLSPQGWVNCFDPIDCVACVRKCIWCKKKKKNGGFALWLKSHGFSTRQEHNDDVINLREGHRPHSRRIELLGCRPWSSIHFSSISVPTRHLMELQFLVLNILLSIYPMMV